MASEDSALALLENHQAGVFPGSAKDDIIVRSRKILLLANDTQRGIVRDTSNFEYIDQRDIRIDQR